MAIPNLLNVSKTQPTTAKVPKPDLPDSLLTLRNAYKKAKTSPVDTVLLYGAPKSGKTALAGSIASMSEIKRVFYFDVEGSSTTLLNPEIGLTDEALDKIHLIQIKDTKASSAAIESMLKYFSIVDKPTVSFCNKHSKVNCVRCKGNKEAEANSVTIPSLPFLTSSDCIVIDTLSQVGVSAFWAGEELARREEIATGKYNAFGKYMKQGELLLDLLSMIQAARSVNIICIAHAYTLDEDDKTKPTRTVPAIGTQNFSRNAGKFFPTIVYMAIENKKFKSGCDPLYKLNTLSGSRLGKKIESIKDRPPVMADLLVLD